MEGPTILMYQHNQYYENGYIILTNLDVQCNPHQIINGILYRNRKPNPNVHMETQKTIKTQSNPEQNEKSWRYHNTRL
jgi:hypothetical protein